MSPSPASPMPSATAIRRAARSGCRGPVSCRSTPEPAITNRAGPTPSARLKAVLLDERTRSLDHWSARREAAAGEVGGHDLEPLGALTRRPGIERQLPERGGVGIDGVGDVPAVPENEDAPPLVGLRVDLVDLERDATQRSLVEQRPDRG